MGVAESLSRRSSVQAMRSRWLRREDRKHRVRGITPEPQQRHVLRARFQLDEALQRRELDAHNIEGCLAVLGEEPCGQEPGIAVAVHRPRVAGVPYLPVNIARAAGLPSSPLHAADHRRGADGGRRPN
jgi:hypothetical protein